MKINTQKNKKSYYAIIPADVRYSGISANAKLLYGEITALCNEKGYCWASNAYFAELYSVTNRAISEWIRQLVEYDFISYEIKDEFTRHIFIEGVGRNLPGGRKKTSRGVGRKLLHNNTVNNTNKKDFSKKEKSSSSYKQGDTTNNKIREVFTGEDGEELEERSKKSFNPEITRISVVFRDLCQKHIGERPQFAISKQGRVIKLALRVLPEKTIYDLFEWWFLDSQGKQDYDLMQITQALSNYNIDKYKIQHSK